MSPCVSDFGGSVVAPAARIAALADEVTRYLEAIDLCRALGLHVNWQREAAELGRSHRHPVPWGMSNSEIQGPARCRRCAGPLARINGRHICFWPQLRVYDE